MRAAAAKSSNAFNWLTPAILAWSAASLFYFYQYVLRSAPGVMVPQMTDAFGLTAGGLSALVGLFYYGYAPFSLIAGIAMDRLGPQRVTPAAAAVIGVGALLFATGNPAIAAIGSFLQGAAAVFAFVAAVYIATTRFPASQAATLIGLTQMLGMAGGSAGLFLVGPAIMGGLPWSSFWVAMGLAGFVLAVVLLAFMPKDQAGMTRTAAPGSLGIIATFGTVFRNPQSLLCGGIAGLLFVPTTVFGMVWGVQFLQEAHDLPYTAAVMRSASVPIGWMIGAPLLGALSDRIGRRKPVIMGGALVLLATLFVILYGSPNWFPPYSLGFIAGLSSSAAMLPYIVIKEANRSEHSGTATGVISFLNFSLSAILGPLFGALLARASGGDVRDLVHYQTAFGSLLYVVATAIVLTVFLRETGQGRPARAQTPVRKATDRQPRVY